MSETLFHCTFTDRNMTGHVHKYKRSWNKLPYVYAACIVLEHDVLTKVVGGGIILTDIHHSDDDFIKMLTQDLLQWDDFKHFMEIPFILQPFQLSRLASEFPIAENEYYELLFEKYLQLSSSGKMLN